MPIVKTVAVTSKPDQIGALRATWRKTAEHKTAQVKLFLSTLGGLLALQAISDATSGKVPFTTVHDVRSLWFYLAPVALVAWRQLHPALTASAVDSAPGATIVPAEVAPAAPNDAGHAEAGGLTLLGIITLGVFLGGLILHLVLT